MSDKNDDPTRITEEDVRNFKPPSPALMGRALTLTRAWHRPVFFGLDHVDADEPTLYVGNHTIYGGLDMPMFFDELHRKKGVFIRGLADRGHFMVPGWRDVLKRMGAAVGTRENCRALMNAGAHVLVFPGGAREVNKRKGEAYQLIWKERLGFARMAVEHGYRIIPFGAVGAEDCFDILYDGDELMRSPVGMLLSATGLAEKYLRNGEAFLPISRGVGLSLLPKPERFYFGIGAPIETKHLMGQADDEAVLRALRDQVRDAVQAQIAAMQDYRKSDPKRGLVSGWLAERLAGKKAASDSEAPRRKRPAAVVVAPPEPAPAPARKKAAKRASPAPSKPAARKRTAARKAVAA